jgi:putative ABC transport system substrate-binding protein
MTAGDDQLSVISRKQKGARPMIRRIVIWLLTTVFLASASFAEAQQAKKVARIGFLSFGSGSSMADRVDAFRQGLREHGYIEGQNIFLEYRYAEGNQNRLREFAAELARLKVDAIVTGGSIATRPAKEATNAIPIIMAYDFSPVESGIVASLARPGGNITGLTSLAAELSAKRLELLKEAVPKLTRVAVFVNPSEASYAKALKECETVAKSLGLSLQSLKVRSPEDIDIGFQAATKNRAGALMVMGDPVTFTNRKRVVDLVIKNRLPSIHGQIQFVEAGALMAYGADEADMYRRSATFVDKILKGAKPADLPVEQPIKFEFIINLKAAKQIGLTIPPNVLARADRVIK